MRLATGHAFISEYHERFFPTHPVSACTCPCDDSTLATFVHVLVECPLYAQARATWMLTIWMTLRSPKSSIAADTSVTYWSSSRKRGPSSSPFPRAGLASLIELVGWWTRTYSYIVP
ncbi:hypothetical protein B0F90DRAFT_481042 [Multifurca ochricompacta]|uniref:Reverse transcriptase zinc-binding domain-containing protein n=1 Tax=Multifurca ochricompacta TaxID=376703 RepID=A0AAD4MB76_9AGAM|nr:hypothetical protein B0F90DRAFT_481042 [Multifurca ochricompacta]